MPSGTTGLPPAPTGTTGMGGFVPMGNTGVGGAPPTGTTGVGEAPASPFDQELNLSAEMLTDQPAAPTGDSATGEAGIMELSAEMVADAPADSASGSEVMELSADMIMEEPTGSMTDASGLDQPPMEPTGVSEGSFDASGSTGGSLEQSMEASGFSSSFELSEEMIVEETNQAPPASAEDLALLDEIVMEEGDDKKA
jgi:hypothetical protein